MVGVDGWLMIEGYWLMLSGGGLVTNVCFYQQYTGSLKRKNPFFSEGAIHENGGYTKFN